MCVAAVCLTPLFRADRAPSTSRAPRPMRHPGVVSSRPLALTPDHTLTPDPALATLATELRLVHERDARGRASLDTPPPPLFAALY